MGLMKQMGCRPGVMTQRNGWDHWRCHCPWPEGHTDGHDDEGAYIEEQDDKWPRFSCSHSSHVDLSLADICELAGLELLREFADNKEILKSVKGWMP